MLTLRILLVRYDYPNLYYDNDSTLTKRSEVALAKAGPPQL